MTGTIPSPGVQPLSDHPVRRVLERDVLPYLVSARRLRKRWFYILNILFGVTTDLVVALATVGVTSPLLRLLQGASGEGGRGTGVSLADVLAAVPTRLAVPTAVLIIGWIVLRVVFNREEGQKRAVLAKNCSRVLRAAEASLPAALAASDPMPALTNLLEKSIRPTVDRNIQEDAWPWVPFAPRIDAQVAREVEVLCRRYASGWTPVASPGLRQPAAGGSE